MAGYFYNGTGHLSLLKLTPVISCLFSPFLDQDSELENNSIGFKITSGNSIPSWEVLEPGLRQIAQDMNIPVADDEHILELLHVLGKHFIEQNHLFDADCILQRFEQYIQTVFFDDEISFNNLYEIAWHLDDGHQIACLCFKGIDMEGLEGSQFISNRVELRSSSNDAIVQGILWERLFCKPDNELFDYLHTLSYDTMLKGLKDPEDRRKMALRVAHNLRQQSHWD